MRLAIDVDGVVADTHTAWIARYNAKYETTWSVDDLTQWEFWYDLGCTDQVVRELWDASIYKEIKPFVENVKAVKMLRGLAQHIVFVSSCAGAEEEEAKRAWLTQHGLYEVLIPVGKAFAFQTKADVAAALDLDWLVDDNVDNVVNWPGTGFLLSQPHNAHVRDFAANRIATLHDIVALFPAQTLLLPAQMTSEPVFTLDSTSPADFTGEVDGGGYKRSMHDSKKLPLWLVPSSFVDVVTQVPAPYLPLTALFGWVNRGNPRGLESVVNHFVADHGEVEVLRQVAAVLQHGKKKYAANNWRRGMLWSEVASAALRHLLAILDDELVDSDSNLPHWAHACCCVAFLIEYETKYNLYEQFDDRIKYSEEPHGADE